MISKLSYGIYLILALLLVLGFDLDGVLHRPKLRLQNFNDFMIRRTIVMDSLGVSPSNRLSVTLAGLGCPTEDRYLLVGDVDEASQN